MRMLRRALLVAMTVALGGEVSAEVDVCALNPDGLIDGETWTKAGRPTGSAATSWSRP